MDEFNLIDTYFVRQTKKQYAVDLGIGDDAAMLSIPAGERLVTSIDTLVAGVHFFESVAANDLGHKSLAVSLSDMAAMGASPFSVLLSITLPKADAGWLKDFSHDFFALADAFDVALVGGDTTSGPLSISTVVNGLVPEGEAICRRGAKVGDLIYVTGHLGDAGLALALLKSGEKQIDQRLLTALQRPVPRVKEGLALRGLATAAIDISDGLLADLEKILKASQLGAVIYAPRLPISLAMQQYCQQGIVSESAAWELALSAGDDYELCFTIEKSCQQQLEQIAQQFSCQFQCVGEVVAGEGCEVLDGVNKPLSLRQKGYVHF